MNYELIKKYISDALSGETVCQIIEDGKIIVDGSTFKPMPWRYERRLQAVHQLSVTNASVSDICSYKASVVESKYADVSELLYRELDVCQWLLNDKIATVYALAGGEKTISLIAKTKSEILCSIDIATTLSDETTPITRHEIVGKEGVISDRCVDERIPTKAMYVFADDKKDPSSYTDLDLYVSGLQPEEVYYSEWALDIIRQKEYREIMTKTHQELLRNMDYVHASLKTGDIVKVEEEI